MAGIDVALNTNPSPGECAWDVQFGADGDLVMTEGLDTAILVSLYTDRRAEPQEVVIPQLRRGWIGDLETPEDPIGSKLYFLNQARLSDELLRKAETWASLALEWLVRDNVAVRIGADAEIDAEGTMELSINITRPNGQVDRFLTSLWSATGA